MSVSINFRLLSLIWLILPILQNQAVAESEDETAWNKRLKKQFFSDRTIEEDSQTINISAPYRAEDPALVPIQITSLFPQTKDHYIKSITVVIDNNPVPFAAAFLFTPDAGRADIATRMRFNAYTYIRAIAETNDGKLHMAKAFVKASGGCSAPIGTDIDAAMSRIGKMKIKLEADKVQLNQPNPIQLLISHPNITGLQMDQISRMVKPAHYMDEIRITFNDKLIMSGKTDIAISSDPNFRTFFVPEKSGDLKVEIKDNLGARYTFSQSITP